MDQDVHYRVQNHLPFFFFTEPDKSSPRRPVTFL